MAATQSVIAKYSHLEKTAFLSMHCNGNSFYIFLFWELRGLSPNFHIHVSVSNLYIPRICPHISSSRKGRTFVGIYNSLTDTWMWKLGLRFRYSFSGNINFKVSAFCLCSVASGSKFLVGIIVVCEGSFPTLIVLVFLNHTLWYRITTRSSASV